MASAVSAAMVTRRAAHLTNEELAVLVKNGEQGRTDELWEGVKGFVTRQAQKFMSKHEYNGVYWALTIHDLVNSGFCVLHKAVSSFDPQKSSFIGWYKLFLQTAFNEAAGFRTKQAFNDPVRLASCLDAPCPGHDDLLLAGVVEDPTSAEMLEDKTFNEELHEALEAALSAIPPKQSDVLRMRYYEGLTHTQIGERIGKAKQTAQQREMKGLAALRSPEIACKLRPFIQYDFYAGSGFYQGTGIGAFERNGMRMQERYMILTEDKEYMEEQQRKQEREAAEMAHQQAKADLINEIQSKQAELDISARQLLLATGMAPKTLKRRMEDPDGLTVGELWKIVDTLHLDPSVVQSALGYIQQ